MKRSDVILGDQYEWQHLGSDGNLISEKVIVLKDLGASSAVSHANCSQEPCTFPKPGEYEWLFEVQCEDGRTDTAKCGELRALKNNN